MKKTRPFTLSFPDQTILIDTSQLPSRKGIPIFSTTAKTEYLERNHPEKLDEYLQHLENFKNKFDKIETLIHERNQKP